MLMISSKTRVLTSLGVIGLLAACGAEACSSKSDSGGGAGSGATAAGGSSGANGAGKGGQNTAGSNAGGSQTGGEAGNDTVGGSAGAGTDEGGAAGAEAGGSGGTGATCNANLQTDPKNCGRCGHSCGTADCSSGLCNAEPVLVPKPVVAELTESGFSRRTFFSAGNLYAWEKVEDSTQNPDLRYRLLRTPAPAAALPATPAPGTIVQDIPDDGSAPYFVDAVNYDASYLYQCTTTGGTRVPLNGTAAAPTVIFKAPVANIDCNSIAVGPTALFISSHNTVAGKDTLYTLPLTSLGPNAVPTLVPNIGARDNDIFALTVVGTNLYWMENDLSQTAKPPNLVTAPSSGLAAGAKPTKIDEDLGSESASIASDGSYLYWTDTHGGPFGEVRRTKLPFVPGTKPEAVLQNLDGVNPGIVMDANYLYVMESNNELGTIVYRVAKDGSTADQLGIGVVFNPSEHKGLQMTGVDANYVYFLLFDGILARLPNKP